MFTYSLVFFANCFLFGLVLANDKGISAYCNGVRQWPTWYPPTPIECCNDKSVCAQFIEAGERKYGLYNPLGESVRHCSCERKMYKCLTQGASTGDVDVGTVNYYFRKLHCFDTDDSCAVDCDGKFKLYSVSERVLRPVLRTPHLGPGIVVYV